MTFIKKKKRRKKTLNDATIEYTLYVTVQVMVLKRRRKSEKANE